MFKAPLAPCSDFSEFHDHYNEAVNENMKEHMDAKQFFCPQTFDLSIYGQT